MSEVSPKGSLPYGWQVKTSKKYPDRIYYFNVFTGSSTWECPVLDPPRELPKGEVKVVKNLESELQKVSQTVKPMLEKKRKYDHTNTPNSEKHFPDHSQVMISPFSPSDDSVKSTVPPTAVVVPVVHKQGGNSGLLPKPSTSGSASSSKVDVGNKLNFKRKVITFDDSPVSTVQNTVKLKVPSNKQKISFLNKTDSNEKKGTVITLRNSTSTVRKTVEVDHPSNKRKKVSPLNRTNLNKKNSTVITLRDSPVSIVQKTVKVEEASNKLQKVSPLNRTDLKEKNSEDKTVIKKLKKLTDNSSESSSVEDIPEIAVDPSESSSDEKNEVQDIEMCDVSIDFDDLTAKKETELDAYASYYIVVDTNVLIGDLHLINELKDTPVDGCGPPHIFIPWVVIEELDRLKSNRYSKVKETKMAMRASCEAIRYLNTVLGKHPRFHGQSPKEEEEWARAYRKCNDDRILECCMALSDKMSPEKVILLTNDRNLTNKAVICDINVHNWTSMMKSIKPNVSFHFTKEAKGKKNANTVDTKDDSDAKEDIKKILIKRASYKREIHTLMCIARQLLKNVLTKLLEVEMFKTYGHVWQSFPIQKHLLEGVIHAMLKYWVVFAEIMTDKDKRNLQLLVEKAVRPEGFLSDKEECLIILSAIEDVFRQVQNKCPHMQVPVERIQEFRVACVEAFFKYCDVDNNIRAAEDASTLAIFENNWNAVNELCGLVLDCFEFPHEFQYNKPSVFPSSAESRQLLCNLYPGVQLLKTSMFKVLDAVKQSKPTKTVCKNLHDALVRFLPSLEIPYCPVTYPHLSAKSLERFCTHPNNRGTIEIGYKQIDRFFTKLDEALTKLMAAKFKRNASPDRMICDD